MSKRAIGNSVLETPNHQQLPLYGDILTMVVHSVALVCDTGKTLLNLRAVQRNTRDEVQRWMTNKGAYSLRSYMFTKPLTSRFLSTLLPIMLVRKWFPLLYTTLKSIWISRIIRRSIILKMLANAVIHLSTSSVVDARKLLDSASRYLQLSIQCECQDVQQHLKRRRSQPGASPYYCMDHIEPLLAAINEKGGCPHCGAAIIGICNCCSLKCPDCVLFQTTV